MHVVWGIRSPFGYVYEDKWEMFFNLVSGNIVLKSETLKAWI